MKKHSNKRSFKFADGTIYSRAESQYWQIYAPLLGGKMLRQSTGIRIEDDPEGEQARLFLANLRQSKSQLLKSTKKEQAYKQALNLIAEDCGYTPIRLTIKDAVKQYMNSVGGTDGTKRIYYSALAKLEKYIGLNTLIDTITPKMLEDFRTNLSNKIGYDTIQQTMNSLRIFFNYLMHKELLDTNPIKLISRYKNPEPNKKMRIFTKEEIDLLLKGTHGSYWETAIYLGIYTGQRLMDIFNLKWEQVDLEHNTIHFHIQKTKKELISNIHPQLKEYLNSISDKEGKLCKTDKSQVLLSIEFHKLLIKLNIIEQKPKGEGSRKLKSDLTFHSLRKTLNSWLASSGISPEIRSKIIGNTKEINQKHYTEIQDEAVINAVNSLQI